MLDYCPMHIPYANKDCLDDSNDEELILGQRYGAESRCMRTTLVQGARPPISERPGCFERRCSSSGVLELYIDGAWHACPTQGGALSVPGYSGAVQCPVSTRFCCAGGCTYGDCFDNVCYCWQGYVGAACDSCHADAVALGCSASCQPQPCVTTLWSMWTACSPTTCKRTRSRTVTQPMACGGTACPALTQEETCATPQPCVPSLWTEWTTCSASCSPATRTRQRSVQSAATCGASSAACTPLMQSEPCGAPKVDCKSGEWSQWSTTCTQQCAGQGGVLIRT